MNPLASALGRRKVDALSAILGGRTIRVPTMSAQRTSREARARLVRLIGAELAADLITAFPNVRVYVPRGPSPHNSKACPIDPRKVDRMTRRGLSAAQIAVRLGCTVRTVHKKRALLAQRRK